MMIALHAVALAASFGPALSRTAEPLPIVLNSVREVRQVDLVEREAEGFMFAPDRPSLILRFDAQLPEGGKVLEVIQPEDIVATDNAGTDLSLIPPDIFDKREWFDDDTFADTPRFTLTLLPAARQATTFSVRASGRALVSFGIETHDVEPREAWTPFTHPGLAGVKAEYRFKVEDDRGEFRVRPAEARNWIESILPATEDATEPGGYSISYNDEFASFDVDVPAKGQKMRLFLRKGLATLPVEVDIKDQPLP